MCRSWRTLKMTSAQHEAFVPVRRDLRAPGAVFGRSSNVDQRPARDAAVRIALGLDPPRITSGIREQRLRINLVDVLRPLILVVGVRLAARHSALTHVRKHLGNPFDLERAADSDVAKGSPVVCADERKEVRETSRLQAE